MDPTGEMAEPTGAGAPMRGGREQRTICFDCSKREIFTPSTGLKALRRRLQNSYRVTAYAAAHRLRRPSMPTSLAPRALASSSATPVVHVSMPRPAARPPQKQGRHHAGEAAGGVAVDHRRAARDVHRRRVRRDEAVCAGGRRDARVARRGRRGGVRHQYQLLHRGVWDRVQLGRGGAHGVLQVPAPQGGPRRERRAQPRHQRGGGQAPHAGDGRLGRGDRRELTLQPRVRVPVR